MPLSRRAASAARAPPPARRRQQQQQRLGPAWTLEQAWDAGFPPLPKAIHPTSAFGTPSPPLAFDTPSPPIGI